MTLDVKDFLSPIHAKKKCGNNLRYESIYDEIKKARFSEDPNLPQGVWVRAVAEADWDKVESLCREVLQNQSKDLQVAAWLMEARYHLHGLKGLIEGLTLIWELSQVYWPNIHPGLETGYRASPFHWINEKFSTQLLSFVLEVREENEVYTFSDYKRAKLATDKSSTLKLDELLNRLKKSPMSFFQQIKQNCTEALTISEDIEKFVENKLEGQEVSLYRLRQHLGELIALCDVLLPKQIDHVSSSEKVTSPALIPLADNTTLEDENMTSGRELVALPLWNDRHSAYEKIEEIATYLQSIEPHSPTPYLLRKAVTWGQMSLQELLEEFIKSGLNLQQMQNWIGIPQKQQEGPQKGTEDIKNKQVNG